MIASLCLLLLCKGEIYKKYPQPVVTIEYQSQKYENINDDEFIFNNTAIVTPSISITYFKEIKELEKIIKESKKEKYEEFIDVLEKIVTQKFVPSFFYRDIIEYAIWLYHFSTIFAITLTVLYKRRFHLKIKND